MADTNSVDIQIRARNLTQDAFQAVQKALEALNESAGHAGDGFGHAREKSEGFFTSLVGDIVKGELDRTAPAYTVIKKVLANGSAVLRQTRNPLVQVPPVNLLRLLLSHGIPKTEACGLTARFLTRWEPDRFRGLQADHVRRRYERLGGSRRPG